MLGHFCIALYVCTHECLDICITIGITTDAHIHTQITQFYFIFLNISVSIVA